MCPYSTRVAARDQYLCPHRPASAEWSDRVAGSSVLQLQYHIDSFWIVDTAMCTNIVLLIMCKTGVAGCATQVIVIPVLYIKIDSHRNASMHTQCPLNI